MIKSFTISITEVDDIEVAVQEYQDQIAACPLLRNTVGIVAVHKEFLLSGVYSAVAEAAAFPIIGMTTLSLATKETVGSFLLSIMVLTSDDCHFSSGISEVIPESGDVTEVTQACYHKLKTSLEGEVKLALLYAPIMRNHCPNEYVMALSAIDERVPVFGTMANENADLLFDARVFFNANEYNNKMAMVLISGDITPTFYIGSITEEDIVMPDIGEITASHKNMLLEINNINAIEFLQNLGFIGSEIQRRGMFSTTFLLKTKEQPNTGGIAIARSMVSTYQNAVVFAGGLQENAVISIATISKDTIMQTAQKVIQDINQNHRHKTVLFYSCLGRRYALTNEPLKELTYINESMSDGFTYLAACSGGEICPTGTIDGRAINHEHNQTLIACVF